MKCPSCGTESSGNFCQSCGASLRVLNTNCAACGEKLQRGARFCTRCGAPAGAAPARGARAHGTPSNLPWYIGGGVLMVLAIILAVPMLRDAAPEAAGPPVQGAPFAGTAPGAGSGTPPPLTGTTREQADQLYNRIMSAWSQNDSAGARRFTPMAIDAYRMSQPLDDDGLYHLAMVHNVAGDHATALTTAEQILAKNANHLLALAAAIEATMPTDQAAARAFARRFVAAWETEKDRPLQEYLDHERVLPDYLAMAQNLAR